jgi:hypothetical protein
MTWRVVLAGPFGLDLHSVEGLNLCDPLWGSDGDGTHVRHTFLPANTTPHLAYVSAIDRINNRIAVSLFPGSPAVTPNCWLTVPTLWLWRPDIGRITPATGLSSSSRCDCGSEKGGGGHYHWCATVSVDRADAAPGR